MSPLLRWLLRTGTALLFVVLVLSGVWVAGGLVTDDAAAARLLTGGWLGLSGLLALALARARREVAVAAVTGWFITAAAAGGFLLLTSSLDRVVDEDVVMAAASDASEPSGSPTAVLDASGVFRSGAHDTRGRASLVRTSGGARVLTLTRFETAPGPDLRVYVVSARNGIEDAVDLGRLKGNKGDQQYVVPRGTRVGSVVIWCRAFSVAFGTARLVDSPAP